MTPTCPHCGGSEAYAYASRPILKCKGCGKQFPATVGTIWRNSKMPAVRRSEIEGMLKRGLNCLQVQRRTGASYPTVWKAAKRIRDACC